MESAQRRYSKPRITRDHLHEKYNTDLGLHRGISHFLSLKATWSKKPLQIGKVMTTESTSRTRPGWGAVVVAGGGLLNTYNLCAEPVQTGQSGFAWGTAVNSQTWASVLSAPLSCTWSPLHPGQWWGRALVHKQWQNQDLSSALLELPFVSPTTGCLCERQQ